MILLSLCEARMELSAQHSRCVPAPTPPTFSPLHQSLPAVLRKSGAGGGGVGRAGVVVGEGGFPGAARVNSETSPIIWGEIGSATSLALRP